jgi:hypothetical protein
MIEADRVLSTPPTNTPIDSKRRRFLAIAAGASIVSVGSLVAAAAPPTSTPEVSSAPVDPIYAAIAAKQAADVAHGLAIDVQDDADARYGHDSQQAWDADEACEEACHRAMDAAWQLAITAPTTLDGVAAILRFANQHEEEGFEWPDSDRVGREGWHYQLRATMASAIEAIIRQQAVLS